MLDMTDGVISPGRLAKSCVAPLAGVAWPLQQEDREKKPHKENVMKLDFPMFLAAAVITSAASVAFADTSAPTKAAVQVPTSTDEARAMAARLHVAVVASPATLSARVPTSTDEARAVAARQPVPVAPPTKLAAWMPTSTDEARGISAPLAVTRANSQARANPQDREQAAACAKFCNCLKHG